MGAQSTVRRTLGRAKRLMPLAAALLLAALVAVPASNVALAQAPPDQIVLVNADRDFVERKKKGEFVARPVFDREIASLFYAVRDADTGDWISAMYRVRAGRRSAQTAGSIPSSTRPSTSNPRSTPTGPICW